MPLRPDTSLQYLKGVGPKLGELLARKGLRTIQDLLEFYPRTYEDRRAARNIASLQADESVSLKAQVIKVSSISMGRSSRKMYDVTLQDASGRIHCKFFRVPYKGYFERFRPLQEIRVVGKVTDYRGRLEFHHPDLRDVEADEELQDKLVPIYVEIDGISSAKLWRMIQAAYADLEGAPTEVFPESFLKKYQLIPKFEAVKQLHFPDNTQSQQLLEMKTLAHRRLIFEEFFWLEYQLAGRKSTVQKNFTKALPKGAAKVRQLQDSLPFQLTGAQQKVFAEIAADLQKNIPMLRLVQGDVGSGKTLVAFMAALLAIENQSQVVLMAPTEILAEQHFKNAQKWLVPLGCRLAMLTGKSKASERRSLLEDLASGKIDFLIGTHALIEDPVIFKQLSLVIVDEQHRFGVEQRAALQAKGQHPHTLVMTATPIPRTLALTVYGDLDVSTINEMPAGRSPIQTRVAYESKRGQVLKFLSEQIEKGRQAYVVYPLVSESEKMDLKDALTAFESLKEHFPNYSVGLLHGQMKSQEKDEVMDLFRKNKIQILVSTTVIEVGVDVPNANMMIIEHSERFGLSQLHQLRGRVGRGEHKSFCILMLGYAVSDEARQRVEMMERSTDGFAIAEFDLQLRGPGEFLGTRQSGLAGFKLASLVRDQDLLQLAREAAFSHEGQFDQYKKDLLL
ncbi:MAG: ATP-dependent DNA helicase RecG [Pseudobdellovibrionaceae bacterium]